MIVAALLFAFQTQEPVLGDCARDPDMLAARAASMRCAVVPCSATLGHEFTEADYRLRTLTELLPLLIPR